MCQVFNKNAILAEIIKRTYIEGMDPFNEVTKQKGLPYRVLCCQWLDVEKDFNKNFIL